jgi:hypothetical protein|tara:strand:+ start:929 stop:1162 length:234 start_codon:yes stop_codon:yes gene_type:complete
MYNNDKDAIFLVHKTGEAVKVKLNLARNYIKSLQRGGIPFLRKIGWDIAKEDKRKYRNWKDLKRERIFSNDEEKRNM